MRKITVTVKPKGLIAEVQKSMFEKVESIDILEMLRIDFEKGIKVGLAEYRMKEGYSFDDVVFPEYMEKVAELKTEGDACVVIVKVNVPKEWKKIMKEFDMDLIWDTPMHSSLERTVFSVTGREPDLKRFLELIPHMGDIEKVSFHAPSFSGQATLSCLTEKQKQILRAAKESGYYEYPRRINAEELARRVGTSKATVVEHLRKAENRIMEQMLAGF